MKRLSALWHRLTSWWQTRKLPDYHQYPFGGASAHLEDDPHKEPRLPHTGGPVV
jgi:hypothetical protein